MAIAVIQNSKKPWILRSIADLALAGHLAAAAGYWWLSPKGFPLDNSRFWLNSVMPVLLVAVACTGLIGIHKSRWPVAATVVLFFATTWCAGAISGRVIFPISLRGIWVIAAVIGGAGLICFVGLVRGESRSYRIWLFSTAAAVFVGLLAIWAQIPPPASTAPINAPPSQMTRQGVRQPPQSIVHVGPGCEFDTTEAELTLTTGDIRINCRPILNFDRVSPDGFWSLFAPGRNRFPSPTAQSNGDNFVNIRYSADSIVAISTPTPKGLLRLTAFTPIAEDTYSHLNTYCYFEISGHKRLSLTFSPCPDVEIEVLPADYPVGRPARLAYLDDANQFSVVEAKSGEKGPFRELAAGPLAREDALTIVVRDERQPVARITLEDWSKQVSTDLSPCAGWRLPMNAIEFQRFYDAPSAPGGIWITLAGTSVGRGWETVGHRAGIYRNGLVFEKVED
jgi:hypothetical protein